MIVCQQVICEREQILLNGGHSFKQMRYHKIGNSALTIEFRYVSLCTFASNADLVKKQQQTNKQKRKKQDHHQAQK